MGRKKEKTTKDTLVFGGHFVKIQPGTCDLCGSFSLNCFVVEKDLQRLDKLYQKRWYDNEVLKVIKGYTRNFWGQKVVDGDVDYKHVDSYDEIDEITVNVCKDCTKQMAKA